MNDNDDDTSPEPAANPLALITAFAAVPREKDRSNGWKPQVQRAFIAALAETGSVKAACARVGRSDNGAYQLRRHPEAHEFRAAWDAALDLGIRRLEDALTDRAIHGVEVPVFCFGNLIAYRTVHNDRLGMFMLRNRLPERYAAGGGPKALNAVGQMETARLKKQWRAEWEAEQRALRAEKEKETFDSIDRMLEKMRNNRLAHMSPVQRERQIAADAQAKADAAAGWRPGGAYREYAEEAARLLPRFIAETEADWPELPSWAWDDPDEEEAEADACPEPVEGRFRRCLRRRRRRRRSPRRRAGRGSGRPRTRGGEFACGKTERRRGKPLKPTCIGTECEHNRCRFAGLTPVGARHGGKRLYETAKTRRGWCLLCQRQNGRSGPCAPRQRRCASSVPSGAKC
jgi:hypothetical protein